MADCSRRGGGAILLNGDEALATVKATAVSADAILVTAYATPLIDDATAVSTDICRTAEDYMGVLICVASLAVASSGSSRKPRL